MKKLIDRWLRLTPAPADGVSEITDVVDDAESGSLVKKIGIGLLGGSALVLVLFFGNVLMNSGTDADTQMTPGPEYAREGGSKLIEVVQALIHREVNENGRAVNDPFFQPGWWTDNRRNFQTGVMYAASRVTVILSDAIGRDRGTSQIDKDLDTAVGLTKFPGDRWVFEPSQSWMPQATSEDQYRSAITALGRYNSRLAAGETHFMPRADMLIELLRTSTSDLGSVSAVIRSSMEYAGGMFGGIFNQQVDDIFYANRGRIYGYLMVLKAVEQDFAGLVAERNVGAVWKDMIHTLEQAAALEPHIVAHDTMDGSMANHLAGQGLLIMMARTKMDEIADIVAK